MATQMDPKELDLQEQLVRIRRHAEESDKFSAETRKVVADMLKAQAETKILGWSVILQAMLATAALLGAGAAVAKLFFP